LAYACRIAASHELQCGSVKQLTYQRFYCEIAPRDRKFDRQLELVGRTIGIPASIGPRYRDAAWMRHLPEASACGRPGSRDPAPSCRSAPRLAPMAHGSGMDVGTVPKRHLPPSNRNLEYPLLQACQSKALATFGKIFLAYILLGGNAWLGEDGTPGRKLVSTHQRRGQQNRTIFLSSPASISGGVPWARPVALSFSPARLPPPRLCLAGCHGPQHRRVRKIPSRGGTACRCLASSNIRPASAILITSIRRRQKAGWYA
jgi:hypothetical protein